MQRQHTATVASEADQLEAAIVASGLARDTESIWDIWQARGLAPALQALQEGTDVKTREQETAELNQAIADLRQQAKDAKRPRDKERLEARIAGLDTTARRLMNERHDQLDARQAAQQAAVQQLQANQEAQIRAQLRQRWPGDDTSFDAAYSDLLRAYRINTTLASVEPPAPMPSPRVTI